MAKYVIASEHAGYSLKEYLLDALRKDGFDMTDVGVQSEEPADYPFIAEDLCKLVLSGEYRFGILICGTGVGMSMAANKVVGVRAALCPDIYTARLTREHNDANVLCLAGWLTAGRHALEIAKTFIGAEFTGGRHIPRLEKLAAVESRGIGFRPQTAQKH